MCGKLARRFQKGVENFHIKKYTFPIFRPQTAYLSYQKSIYCLEKRIFTLKKQQRNCIILQKRRKFSTTEKYNCTFEITAHTYDCGKRRSSLTSALPIADLQSALQQERKNRSFKPLALRPRACLPIPLLRLRKKRVLTALDFYL